jgi:hypothetical protein
MASSIEVDDGNEGPRAVSAPGADSANLARGTQRWLLSKARPRPPPPRQRPSSSRCVLTGVRCPVCDGNPRVLVAIRHPAMRRFTRELLEREYHCWVTAEMSAGGKLPEEALARTRADLLVVDAADFPGCCRSALQGPSSSPVIVIGPEPDAFYRHLALSAGATDWIPRERVGEDLGPFMRRALGCIHDPCPSPPTRGLVDGAEAGGDRGAGAWWSGSERGAQGGGG